MFDAADSFLREATGFKFRNTSFMLLPGSCRQRRGLGVECFIDMRLMPTGRRLAAAVKNAENAQRVFSDNRRRT